MRNRLLLIESVSDHFQKSRSRWIAGDKGYVPQAVRRANQHGLRCSAPDNLAANALENRPTHPSIFSISLCAAGASSVRIERGLSQSDQVEHVDRLIAGKRFENLKGLTGWVDMSQFSLQRLCFAFLKPEKCNQTNDFV